VKEGVSLENQKAKIKSYCELKDLTLVSIVSDAGISAKNLNRPGAKKVLNMAKKKEIQGIVVYKLDRMFRSTIDALKTTKLFNKWGIAFHSINESLDTQSAMGNFFFTLTAALAEMERAIIGERTSQALQHKKANGEKTGGYPLYGYDVDPKGKLIHNQHEQKGLSLIHSLHGQGHSLRSICDKLKRQKYKTKSGLTKWHPQVVKKILNQSGVDTSVINRLS
jgi:DNA invertase Pin-like site-specific DNA recombinase